jgi:hypothetical protein
MRQPILHVAKTTKKAAISTRAAFAGKLMMLKKPGIVRVSQSTGAKAIANWIRCLTNACL